MRREEKIGCLLVFLVAWNCWQAAHVVAQGRRSGRDSNSESVSLDTKDGVRLKASYYPSELGKDAVPIVMLHDFKESRTVFEGLAQALQNPPSGESASHAVLTVDLRGHGESTQVQGRGGQSLELEASRLDKQDFRNMVLYDMEAVRKFLVSKNDQGELNLNKLCLMGSGLGANVAVSWAAVDWSTPQLASRKQGQDVKGLILVSPEWSHRGLPLLKPLRHPGVRQRISMMIIYGAQDRKATKSAETVHKNLVRYHPDPPPEEGPEAKDLVLVSRPTALQGTRLLTDPTFGVLPAVDFFLDARLSQQDFEWVSRRR